MPFHNKVIPLTIYFILLTACSSVEPISIPNPTPNLQVNYVTASPTFDNITTAPEPSAPPLSPTSELAGSSLSFINSGQQLGAGNSWDVALGDVDGDGDLDAFVANSAQSEAGNAVWINDGHGAFTRSEQTPGYGQSVALGDLDNDGDLDAVITHWSEDKQSTIWLNDGSGFFADSGQNLGFALRPALGDVDDDSDLDIYLAKIEANTVWLNDGRGMFSDSSQRLGTGITAAVALADLDGDGDLDAMAGGWEEPAKVWLNDGAGAFAEHEQTLSLASVHIHDLALGDIDGDGDMDGFMAVASGDPVFTQTVNDPAEVRGVNSRSDLAAVERLWQRRNAERLMDQGATILDPDRIDCRGEVVVGRDCVFDVNVILEGTVTVGDGAHVGANTIVRRSTIGMDAIIESHCVIEDAEIASRARVGPFARIRPGAVIGEAAHVGNFVEIKNSRLEDGSKVNHLSYIGDASVGHDVNIGAGVITCNYDGANKHRTEIADDVFVGSNSQLVAPVRIGVGATIGAGSTITADVPDRVLAVSRARQRHIIGWLRPRKEKG